jgi:peptidoglycan/LPS O-acetylase OafA/YrhL
MAEALEGLAEVRPEPREARGTEAERGTAGAAGAPGAGSAEEHAAYVQRRHFGSLDGLRCLCITTVIWHHTGPRWDWLPGSKRGFLGVDMFFVISGFLIVTLLLRERDRTGGISLRAFYMRRTLRIFPIYYAVLLAMGLLFGVVSHDSPRTAPYFAELPYYLTYTSNWIHAAVLPLTWSLATEEQFYLVWPLLEKVARRFVLPALALLFVLSQWMNFARGAAYFDPIFGADHEQLHILQVTFTPLCLGVALAHLLHSAQGFGRFGAVLGSRYAPVVVLATLTVLANVPNEDISGFHRLGIQLLMTALVGSAAASETHALRPFLLLPALKRVGVASYGMYLYHVFAQDVAERAVERFSLGSALYAFAICFFLTWGIAELSYRLFESRFLRLKQRFAV